jgi:hypothetical protein
VTASGSFAYAATFLWCCAAGGGKAHKKRHQHTPRVIRLQSAMIRNRNVRLAASSTIHNINAMFNFLPQIYPTAKSVFGHYYTLQHKLFSGCCEKAAGVPPLDASAHKINAKAHKMLFAASIWHYYS